MSKYDDIINLPHHVSPTRKPMPMEARAAQFAPFAALNGHEDAINETARLTDARTELSPDEQKQLSLTLSLALAKDAEVLVTYFLPDPFKSGGRYVQRRGRIKNSMNTTTLSGCRTAPLSLCRTSPPSIS